MITERHLEVRKTLISLCQTYSLVIDEMLEKPSEYGIDFGTEDVILSNMRTEFIAIEEAIKLGEYDPEEITVKFAEAQHTYNAILTFRNPLTLADNKQSNIYVSQDYIRTYNVYILNAIRHNLLKIKGDPERYLTKVTVEEVDSLLKETDLLLAMQDKNVLDSEMLTARIAELTYVFIYEIVSSINAKLNTYYDFHVLTERK